MAGIAAMVLTGILGTAMGLNNTGTFMSSCVAFVAVSLWADSRITRRRTEAARATVRETARRRTGNLRLKLRGNRGRGTWRNRPAAGADSRDADVPNLTASAVGPAQARPTTGRARQARPGDLRPARSAAGPPSAAP